jgi:hypothetical protein
VQGVLPLPEPHLVPGLLRQLRTADVLPHDLSLRRLSYLLLTSQLVTAGVFALAVLGKLRAPEAFAASLADFGLRRARRPVAYAVIAAEAAVIPLALLIAPVGLTLAAVLLLTFAATIIVTLQRGARPTCRCFGAKSAPLRGAHVARNLVLAALAVAGLFAGDHAFAGAPLAVGAILAAVALLVLATFDDLVEVLAPRSH